MPEPIDLAEMKAHLRVTDTSEDDLIVSTMIAARRWIERYTGHILVQRTMTLSFDRFNSFLEIPVWPVVSVGSVTYTDADGVSATYSGGVPILSRNPVRIHAPTSFPTVHQHGNIIVEVVAGYSVGEEPEDLLHALKMLTAYWFFQREAGGESRRGSELQEVPFGVRNVCDQFRPVIAA